MDSKEIKEKVLLLINDLIKGRGIPMSIISKKSTIPYHRLDKIKRGKVKVNELDLQKLNKAYPSKSEKVKEKDELKLELEQRIKQLEMDNKLLKEMMIKLLKERGDTDLSNQIENL